MSESKLRLSTLTYLGFEVNSAIARGRGGGISYDAIYTSLENGTILEDLKGKIPDEFDFSLFPSGSEQSLALNEALSLASEGFRGRESRKVGLEDKNSGLHLLLACVFEAVQQGYWARSSVR